MSTIYRLYFLCAIICSVFIQRSLSFKAISSFHSSRLISKSLSSSALYSSESSESTSSDTSTTAPTKKGFGKSKLIEKEVEEPEVGTKTYDAQAKRGVPEYNIFIRPENGTDTEWIPVGSMVCVVLVL